VEGEGGPGQTAFGLDRRPAGGGPLARPATPRPRVPRSTGRFPEGESHEHPKLHAGGAGRRHADGFHRPRRGRRRRPSSAWMPPWRPAPVRRTFSWVGLRPWSGSSPFAGNERVHQPVPGEPEFDGQPAQPRAGRHRASAFLPAVGGCRGSSTSAPYLGGDPWINGTRGGPRWAVQNRGPGWGLFAGPVPSLPGRRAPAFRAAWAASNYNIHELLQGRLLQPDRPEPGPRVVRRRLGRLRLLKTVAAPGVSGGPVPEGSKDGRRGTARSSPAGCWWPGVASSPGPWGRVGRWCPGRTGNGNGGRRAGTPAQDAGPDSGSGRAGRAPPRQTLDPSITAGDQTLTLSTDLVIPKRHPPPAAGLGWVVSRRR